MKIFWKADHDGAMENCLRLLFVELLAFRSPKFALQNGLEKLVFTATSEMPLRANGDREVTETYLK